MLWFDVENDSNYRFYCRFCFLYSKISSILSQSKYPDARERCHRILTKWQENGIDDVSGMAALTSLVAILRDVKCYQLAGIHKLFDVIDHWPFAKVRKPNNDCLHLFRHPGEGIRTLESEICCRRALVVFINYPTRQAKQYKLRKHFLMSLLRLYTYKIGADYNKVSSEIITRTKVCDEIYLKNGFIASEHRKI